MAKRMQKAKLNLLVDAAGFVVFVLMTATGLVLRWSLPAGSGGLHGGPGRPVSLIWGLSRHQWGNMHFWLAVLLLGVLSLHLFLHWRFVTNWVRGRPREGSGGRLALALVALVALIGLAVAPLVSPKQVVPRGQLGIANTGGLRPPVHKAHRLIRRSMSLRKAARVAGAPVDYFIHRLGFPANVNPDEPLGRLCQRHGLRFRDVRAAAGSRDHGSVRQ